MFRTLSLALLLTALSMPAMAQSNNNSTTTYNTQRTTTTTTAYSGGQRSAAVNTSYDRGNDVAVIPTVKLGVGAYDAFQQDEGAVALKAEVHSTFRPLDSWNSFHPFVGVDTTNHGGYYLNAGVAGDLALTPNWLVTPSLAAGFYEEGGAKDLGTNFALRPGLELAYRFDNEHKVGVEVTSTTGIGSDDDSVEAVTLNYHMPLGVFDAF